MQPQTISVIGLGYIGLPTAAIIASRKKTVIGVDINPHAIDTINRGEIHIIEPDLDIVVKAAVTQGYLRATQTPEPADAFLIAVPTPFTENRTADLSYIRSASQAIASVLKPGNLVILESTSPVGTTEQMTQWLAEARPDLTFPHTHQENSDIRIAYCPERVLPGQVIRELVENDRLIGGMTPKCSQAASNLYRIFVQANLITTNTRTAELAKLTENSFRDVNIAFANELSIICDQLDINVWELISLANRHPRVNILQPGAGVGGHCIAVDPWFIVEASPENARIIRTAREINDHKPHWVIQKIKDKLQDIRKNNQQKDHTNTTIACLGISFKPDIDDLRESPSLEITQTLSECGYQIQIVEPNIHTLPPSLQKPNVTLNSLQQALNEADIICILVKHKDFIQNISAITQHPNLIDIVGVQERRVTTRQEQHL